MRSEQLMRTSEGTRTVRVVLGWDLKEGRKSLLVPIDRRSDLLCNLDRLKCIS